MEPNVYAERLAELIGVVVDGEERIFSKDVWNVLGIDNIQSQHQQQKIVADGMKRNGWRRKRFRIGDKVGHGYWRPT